MPSRIIREAILSSEKMASLNWQEEVFYRRLMSIVDDYGRYEANPQLLRARCYPLQTDAVRVTDISRWMAACQTAGLILCYAVQGKQYLEILNFQQQQRTPSKYPHPPAIDSSCEQMISDAHLVVSVSEVVSEVAISAAPRVELFDEFWKAYPKKKAKDDAKKAFDKRKPDRQLLDNMLSAIATQAASDDWLKDLGKFIPYPATWLNDGRWHDESTVVTTTKVGTDAAEATRRELDNRDRGVAPMPANIRAQLASITGKLTGKIAA